MTFRSLWMATKELNRRPGRSPRGLRRLAAVALLTAVSFATAANTARFEVTDSGAALPQGSTGNQTITVTNKGPDAGTNVVATYQVPTTTGIAVNSVTASLGGACTQSGNIYTCPSVTSVALNGQINLTVNMTVARTVAVGTSAGSTVKVNSAEFNPGSGTGESLFNIWGKKDVSAAAGDAFWFAYDGTYTNSGAKVEGSNSRVADAWPVTQANPPGAYSIKADTGSLAFNDVNSYAPYPAAGAIPPNPAPKEQTIETGPPGPEIKEPVVGGSATNQQRNNRRVWEIRTGIYLAQSGPLYVCVPQPDDAMYVAVDGAVVASANQYNSGVVNSSGATYAAGYHEVLYRIVNRNDQVSSFEGGTGGFGTLGMGTTASTAKEQATPTTSCNSTNYNAFTRVAPSSNITISSASADLAIGKSGPAAIGSRGSMSYTVQVWNNGPSITTSVGVKDTIPSGFTVTDITCAANGSAVCGTQTSTNSSIAVTTGNLTIDSVPTNSTPDGNFLTYTITGTAPASGSLSNTASLTVPAGTTDNVAGNNSTAAVVTRVVDAVNDTAVSYAFGSGGTVSVLGNDTNGGVATTANSTVAISNTGGLTGLTVNGSGQLVVPSAAAPGSYTVTYSLCDKTVTTACDKATVQVTVGVGSLAIAKSFSPTTVVSGGAVTLTLTVTNPNPTPVSALSMTDNVAATMGLPAPLVLRTTANTCEGTPSAANNNSGIYTLTAGSVAASSSCTVTIAFTVSNATAGSKTNTIPAANVTGTVGGTSVTAAAPASASLTVTASNAGGTVTCDANFYQLRQDPTTLLSNLYQLNPAVPDSGGTALWSSGFGPALNALGYNVKDGYFYAVNITPLSSGDPYRLYRLGAGGAVEYAPLTGIPGGSSMAAGTVNRGGVMYLKKQQQDIVIYRYDIASRTLLSSLTVANVQIFDLAINPTDNMLYGVATPGVVYRIDPVTGATSTVGAATSNAIGSAFFNAAGTLYGYQNSGVFGTIDLTTGAFTQTGTPGSATQSDGASCPFGPPPSITLLKLGRNIGPSPVLTTGQLPSANTTAAFVDGSVVIGAKPGDRVEYCIVYTNTGGLAPNFVLTDNVPIIMDALLNAYGPAGEPVATQKGIYWADGKVLIASATAVPDGGVNLTSVSDTDKGTLATTGGLGKGTMTLNLGPAPAGLAAGGQGTVCFQTKVP